MKRVLMLVLLPILVSGLALAAAPAASPALNLCCHRERAELPLTGMFSS
jgi:hypothetical protein